MFRDSIKGLERIFHAEPPSGSITMIVGKPGTLKSSLAHAILSSYLWKHKGEKAVYITIEETEESHIRNMRSLGIAFPKNQYFIKDIASFKFEIAPENDFLQDDKHFNFIMQEISKPFGLYSALADGDFPRLMALDSLNAFQNLFLIDARRLRFRMQDFFQRLRHKRISSLIIVEGDPEEMIPEYFMVDGVIEVGIDRSHPQMPKRYIVVRKMRGTKHEMAPYMLNITENGLEIGEPLIGWKK